jgi:orotate phosphoribosyltransferase
MNIAAEVAKKLLQIKAIKLSPQNPFTWASGILSPIYCDNRIVLSHPEARNFIKEAFVSCSKEFASFDKIAGVATAGIAHGALLADALDMPFIYVRSKAKAHGRQNQIEGSLTPGEKVLVIEDLISTGGSSLKAIEALVEAGAEVVGIAAIFTYGFDRSVKAFENAGYPLKTLSNYDILINEALKTNFIHQTDVQLLKNWREKVNSTN